MRTISALAATAALLWGAPALAADGTLTYDGKTIAVHEVMGGSAFTLDAMYGTGGSILYFDPIAFEVDAGSFTDLMPLVDGLLKTGKDRPNLILSVKGENHNLIGVHLTQVTLPACKAQSAETPRIQVQLGVSMIKTATGGRAVPVSTPAVRTPAAGDITGCTIAFDAAAITADALVYPVSIRQSFAEETVGELRDDDKESHPPEVDDLTLNGETLNTWARKNLIEGQDAKVKVTITYTTASGPVFVLTSSEAHPTVARLLEAETGLHSDTVTITKP